LSERDTLKEIIRRQWELAAQLAQAVQMDPRNKPRTGRPGDGHVAHGAKLVKDALTEKIAEIDARG